MLQIEGIEKWTRVEIRNYATIEQIKWSLIGREFMLVQQKRYHNLYVITFTRITADRQ